LLSRKIGQSSIVCGMPILCHGGPPPASVQTPCCLTWRLFSSCSVSSLDLLIWVLLNLLKYVDVFFYVLMLQALDSGLWLCQLPLPATSCWMLCCTTLGLCAQLLEPSVIFSCCTEGSWSMEKVRKQATGSI
jgi:hypothetical protein